jgi:hypothetical protein
VRKARVNKKAKEAVCSIPLKIDGDDGSGGEDPSFFLRLVQGQREREGDKVVVVGCFVLCFICFV